MKYIKNFKKKVYKKKAGAKLSKMQKQQVSKIISSRQEHKFYDTINSTTASYTGTVISVSDVPQGVGDSQRIGDSLNPTSLEMKVSIFVADNTNFFRIILFRWLPNFSFDSPVSSDILQLVSSTNAINSPYNHDQRPYFKVFFDKTWTLAANLDIQLKEFKKNFKLSKKKIQYLTASTTAQAGGIYALFISDSAAVSHPGINYYFRLNYTDS